MDIPAQPTAGRQLKNYLRSITVLCAASAVVACLLLPALFWKRGLMSGEAAQLIPHYLNERTALQKVFDPRTNDNGTYQARELSYLFDYLDVHIFRLLAARGIIFFVPLTAIVSSVALVAVYLIGIRKTLPHLAFSDAAVTVLPFFTSFIFVSTMGMFYRSGKPLLAPVTLALMFYTLFVDRRQTSPWGKSVQRLVTQSVQALIVFLLCLVMGLLDRQGFFFILVTCVILGIHSLVRKRLRHLLLGAVAAAAIAEFYNLYFGPLIIHAENGYWPDFAYQSVAYGRLLHEPSLFGKAFEILIQNVVAVFGGSNMMMYIFLLVLLVGLGMRRRIINWFRSPGFASGSWPERTMKLSRGVLPVIYALVIFTSCVLMFAIMIIRHRYVYDYVDHRFWYHPLVFTVILIFGLSILLNRLFPLLSPNGRRLVCVLLLFIAASNLLHLEYYKKLTLSSYWFTPYVYYPSELLKNSVRTGVFDRNLDEYYRPLYDLYGHATTSTANDEIKKK